MSPFIHTREKGEPENGWTLIETLAAIVIIGIGIALFTRIQIMTRSTSKYNSNLLKAGHLIEANIDSIRTWIARDTLNNWPPSNGSATVGVITLTSTVSAASSPKDALNIPHARKVDFTASWGSGPLDTLKVTTYVSRYF